MLKSNIKSPALPVLVYGFANLFEQNPGLPDGESDLRQSQRQHEIASFL